MNDISPEAREAAETVVAHLLNMMGYARSDWGECSDFIDHSAKVIAAAQTKELARLREEQQARENRITQLEAQMGRMLQTVENANNLTSECLKERDQLRAQLAAKTQECEGLRGILEHWRTFLKDVETAEDRSNLDGDDAETVLLQLNEGAEAMLALEAQKEGE